MNRLLIFIVFAVALGVSNAFAQSTISSADRTAIAAVWSELAAAVKLKDRVALERIHVHAVGKIDDRKARLDVLLSGEATIDTAAAIEVGLRKFGDVIVAVGKVSTNGDDGKPVANSVTRIYVQRQGRWRFASSHASAIVTK